MTKSSWWQFCHLSLTNTIILVFSPFWRDTGFVWTLVENARVPLKKFLSPPLYQITYKLIFSPLFFIHRISFLTKHTLRESEISTSSF